MALDNSNCTCLERKQTLCTQVTKVSQSASFVLDWRLGFGLGIIFLEQIDSFRLSPSHAHQRGSVRARLPACCYLPAPEQALLQELRGTVLGCTSWWPLGVRHLTGLTGGDLCLFVLMTAPGAVVSYIILWLFLLSFSSWLKQSFLSHFSVRNLIIF